MLMSDISSKYTVMRPSNMVVKIKNSKNNYVSSNEALKTTDGKPLSGTGRPGPFKQSVGDIALQKIKKYEEKYLKKSSTGEKVQGVTSIDEVSDIESRPEDTLESNETSYSPKFNTGLLGNIKFANFSDSESVSEILSDLSSAKPLNVAASSTEGFAEPKPIDRGFELGKDGGEEGRQVPLIMTEVDSESSSVSTYLQGTILPLENLKLDEDKCGNVSYSSKSSDKMANFTCDVPQEKSASYSESFEDVAEKSAAESGGDSVNLSRVRRPEPKEQSRSLKGTKTLNLRQAGCKLENKATQTVFKNVTKAPLHGFVNPLPSTPVPKEDDCHMEPFLFSNFNVAVNVEG